MTDKTFQILSIGEPYWKNGYMYALDACKLLKDNNFNFKYTIVCANFDLELVYQIDELELNNYVQLFSNQSKQELQNLISKSELFLVPNVVDANENWILQAMFLNVLTLSTSCENVNGIICDKQNGFLMPTRDSRTMADKIIEISELSEKEKHAIKLNAFKRLESRKKK